MGTITWSIQLRSSGFSAPEVAEDSTGRFLLDSEEAAKGSERWPAAKDTTRPFYGLAVLSSVVAFVAFPSDAQPKAGPETKPGSIATKLAKSERLGQAGSVSVSLSAKAKCSILGLRLQRGHKTRATWRNPRKCPPVDARFPQPQTAGRLTRKRPVCRRG